MKRFVAGIGASILAVMTGGIVWLAWPLPTSEFDWRKNANQMVEQGDCSSAIDSLALTFGMVGGSEVYEMLLSLSHGELCDFGPGFEATDAFDELAQVPEFMDYRLPEKLRYIDRIRNSFQQFAILRSMRRGNEGPAIDLDDVVASFRCTRISYDVYQGAWLDLRNDLNNRFGIPERLTPWDRRRAECIEIVEAQISRLRTESATLNSPNASLLGEYEAMLFALHAGE